MIFNRRKTLTATWRQTLLPALLPALFSAASGTVQAQSIVSVQQPALPYTPIVPDHVEIPQPEVFGVEQNYAITEVEGFSEVTEFVEIPVDEYSGGTEDPETVYEEMGDGFDTERMAAVVWPSDDPANELPPPTVVPVDGYVSQQINIIPADPVDESYFPEDRIFQLIANGGRTLAGEMPDHRTAFRQSATGSGKAAKSRARLVLPAKQQ